MKHFPKTKEEASKILESIPYVCVRQVCSDGGFATIIFEDDDGNRLADMVVGNGTIYNDQGKIYELEVYNEQESNS